MVLQMSEMDKKISDATPTPEHVEGDVLSVGEMEVVAYAEVLAGRVTAVRIDKSRHCVEPLVTLTSATTRIQRAERERDALLMDCEEYKNAGHGYYARALKAEAQLADAVKVLEPFALISSEGVVRHERGHATVTTSAEYFHRARAFLSTIGEKPDAE